MSPTVSLALLGWFPVVVFLFKWLPPRRAVIISFIVAFLFLPQYAIPLPIFPDYGRMSSTCYAILLSIFLFDINRLKSFKFSWFDVPMLIWCLCPFASSLSNDLGAKDGIVASLAQAAEWGAPYFIGRLYFNNLDGLRQLAVGIFVGGLAYIPFCLFEVRMSPQLHRMVYGFSPPGFAQSIRYGGYRPMVFLDHGLQVALWMAMATLIGIWFWRTGVIKQVLGIPIQLLVMAQIVAVILIKSTGAWILLGVGTLILMISRSVKVGVLLWLLVAIIPMYLYFPASGDFDSERIIDFVAETINPDRASSLEFRFEMEGPLAEKARQRVLFGWGGWGRAALYSDYDGRKISVSDSLWIIAFGNNGVVGLVSLVTALLLPAIAFSVYYPAQVWSHRRLAPATALTMVLVLYMTDSLINDMGSAVYVVACGGLTGLFIQQNEALEGTKIADAEQYLRQGYASYK